MLSEVLIPKLQRDFPGRGLRGAARSSPCAVFPAIHPEVGDLEIYDDGDELTVVAGRFTHGHFSNYDDGLSLEQKAEQITDAVVSFLKAVFADEVVFYGSHEAAGGWYQRGEQWDWKRNEREYVWSGPLT
jgi:hypothetical protein